MAIPLPYRFDTSSSWRTILKGAFALNALIVFGILYSLLTEGDPVVVSCRRAGYLSLDSCGS